MKEIGLHEILKPLIADIKEFEINGVHANSLDAYFKGRVTSVSAHNLSANEFGDFVIAFSSDKGCSCMIQKKDIENFEREFKLRTKTTYTIM